MKSLQDHEKGQNCILDYIIFFILFASLRPMFHLLPFISFLSIKTIVLTKSHILSQKHVDTGTHSDTYTSYLSLWMFALPWSSLKSYHKSQENVQMCDNRSTADCTGMCVCMFCVCVCVCVRVRVRVRACVRACVCTGVCAILYWNSTFKCVYANGAFVCAHLLAAFPADIWTYFKLVVSWKSLDCFYTGSCRTVRVCVSVCVCFCVSTASSLPLRS